MRIKIIVSIILSICLASGVAGYVIISNKNKDNDKPVKTVKQVEKPKVQEKVEESFSLLTNEPLDPELVKKRPIAVMIEHSKAASPQFGINRAGVVYECPMEGGMTRTMALFDEYKNIDRLGDIRSARPYFIYFASEYNAIYFHYGQSVHAKEILDTGIIDDINGLDGSIENTAYYRSDDRRAPHNAFTSTKGIEESIKKKGYSTAYDPNYEDGHFFFADSPNDKDDSNQNKLSEGRPAEAIKLSYPDPKGSFVYYKKSGVYKRNDFGGKASDGLDGKQVSVKNVILQYVDVSRYDPEGPGYLNIPLLGMGKGLYLTNGRVTDITWEKNSDTERTKYYDTSGREIKLNTGKTWICLTDNTKVDQNVVFETREEFEEVNGAQEEQ